METASLAIGSAKEIASLATIQPSMERPHCELPWGVWREERGVGSRHEDVYRVDFQYIVDEMEEVIINELRNVRCKRMKARQG